MRRVIRTNCILIFFLATAMIFSSAARAQTFVFKVMASAGGNEYRSGSEEWAPITRGVSFKTGDLVKVADNAYLGLIHNSGKLLELRDQGTFDVSDIESSLGNMKKGIGGRYTEFVMNTVDFADNDDSEPVVTTRGIEDRIHVFLPISSSALKDVIHIYWEKDEGKSYVVTIKDMFDDVIAKEETNTNSFHMDLTKEPYSDQPTFAISVALKDNPKKKSGEHVIDLLTAEDEEAAREAVEELKADLDLNSSLDHLVLAAIYEEIDLLINATYHHQQAIKISPRVEDFTLHFQEFIQRNRLGIH